jgi:hypothetical protein
MTPRQFTYLSLPDQVRLIAPVARRMLFEGIDMSERVEASFLERIASVTGDQDLSTMAQTASDEEHALLWNRMAAAMALGIALGLMLRPELLLEPDATSLDRRH